MARAPRTTKPKAPKAPKTPKAPKPTKTFGVGEWYGQLVHAMTPQERKDLFKKHQIKKDKPIACPFKPEVNGEKMPCTKASGVCSLKKYVKGSDGAEPEAGDESQLRVTCPHRFREQGRIVKDIGSHLLGSEKPVIAPEVRFLIPVTASTDPISEVEEDDKEGVGRIDIVLVHPEDAYASETEDSEMRWCAVEIQAVYFSGSSMSPVLTELGSGKGPHLPFPSGARRPDYRSSGPKRLMPQLQIKVPTLSRWGKKTAVIVDQGFFRSLGPMVDVGEPSNADIAWFVYEFEEGEQLAQMKLAKVVHTTLSSAVDGLTAGRPVTKPEFEGRIRRKLGKVGPMLEALTELQPEDSVEVPSSNEDLD